MTKASYQSPSIKMSSYNTHIKVHQKLGFTDTVLAENLDLSEKNCYDGTTVFRNSGNFNIADTFATKA